MNLTPTPKGLGSPTFTGESPMDYLSPCRRGLLPLKKRRKLVGAGAAAGRANGHQTDDSSSSGSNVIEPSPEFSLSKGRSTKSAKMSSMGVLASAAAFASSSIVSASSTSDAAAASFLVQSDSSSAAVSAPSIPVLQGMVTTAGNSSSVSRSSSTNKSRTSYQDRRFTDSDPPEARCQATTTRGRACAFVSIVGTKYCNVHANYDTAPPPRRSGFGDGGGGGGSAKVPASPRKAASVVTSSSSTSQYNEHKKTTAGVVQAPGSGTNRPLLNNLPSIQWSKKIVEIAVGPFTGEKGIVLKFGNGWVTVKVRGRDGKPMHHNRRSMELYLLPENGRGNSAANISSKETYDGWASSKITTPSSSGKGSSHDDSETPLSPRSGREIHKPKRYDSSDEEESS